MSRERKRDFTAKDFTLKHKRHKSETSSSPSNQRAHHRVGREKRNQMKATKHKYFAYEDEQTAKRRRGGWGAMSLAISYSCSIIRRRVEHEDTIITSSTPHSEYYTAQPAERCEKLFKSALMAPDTFRERSRLSTLGEKLQICIWLALRSPPSSPSKSIPSANITRALCEAIYQNELINPADCSDYLFTVWISNSLAVTAEGKHSQERRRSAGVDDYS
jgi:hypothetical protein